jgi:hypothetical protein
LHLASFSIYFAQKVQNDFIKEKKKRNTLDYIVLGMWARRRTVSRKPKFSFGFLLLWDFNKRQRLEWNKQGEMKEKRK